MHHYRASDHVVLGVANEHTYNMFLSVMEMCHRLGLWDSILNWKQLQKAYFRISTPIDLAHFKRKNYAHDVVEKAKNTYET